MWVVAYLQGGNISPFYDQARILCDEMCSRFLVNFDIISSAPQSGEHVFMVQFIHKWMSQAAASDLLTC